MKKVNFLKDFLNLSEKLKNKKIQKPKVGDNILIKFFYVQGVKVLRFYSKIFFGRCIALKRINQNTSLIVLRNVYNRDPIELSFFLNSPFVIQLTKKRKNNYLFFKKNKLYFFRTKKIAQNKIKR